MKLYQSNIEQLEKKIENLEMYKTIKDNELENIQSRIMVLLEILGEKEEIIEKLQLKE